MAKKFTRQDAFKRITSAKTSSLWREKLSEEYLTTLRVEVAKWLGEIDEVMFYLAPTPEPVGEDEGFKRRWLHRDA